MPAPLVPAAIAVAKAVGPTLATILLPMLLGKVAGSYDKHLMETKSIPPGDPQLPAGLSMGNQPGQVVFDPKTGNYLKLGKTGQPLKNPVKMLPGTPGVPYSYKGQGALRKAASFGNKWGTLASILAPYAIGAVGRAIQGAGATAGAATQAVANIPAHLANMKSDSQRARYGGTPLDALGGILSDLGGAAGTGLSMAGNVVGGTALDASNAMRMVQLQKQLQQMTYADLEKLKGIGADRGALDLAGHLAVGRNNVSRGAK